MLLHQVAIVSEVPDISASELTQVGAALQTQATRDLGPLWGVQATVAAFDNLEDVPIGYWPILVQEDLRQPGAAGIHMDRNGHPYALVQYDDSWSLTASHECLEMLVDPFGFHAHPGQSKKSGQGRVLYLVEACDPCEGTDFAYTVGGVVVSDFITPHFYDPLAVTGVQYSFTGAIEEPLQVLPDGYISWFDPRSSKWYQLTMFGGSEKIVTLGRLARFGSIREAVDAVRPNPLLRLGPKSAIVKDARAAKRSIQEGRRARAKSLRDHIERLKANTGPLRKAFSEAGATGSEDLADEEDEDYGEEEEGEDEDYGEEEEGEDEETPRERTDRAAREARERARRAERSRQADEGEPPARSRRRFHEG
jgi:hypothetical protein